MDQTPDKNPLFLQSYWNRPDNEIQGDHTGQLVYQAVGYALSRWEMMEESLAELYLQLVGAPKASGDPIRRAFGAIESNSGRRKAIDAAAEAYLERHWEDRIIRTAFLNLTQAIGNASKRRDDIAHGIVLGQQLDHTHYGFFLFPPDYNTLRTYMYADTGSGDPLAYTMTKYRFTSKQVCDFAEKFGLLQNTVQDYRGLLSAPDIFVRWVKGIDIFGGKTA